jgi:hypothetical protein
MLALIPAVSGLSVASGAAAITHSFRVSLVIAAGLAMAAAPLAFIGLSRRVRAPRTLRHVHCAVDGAPLQADPARCPEEPATAA